MEYNRQQQAIIDCRDNNMIVVACPGSGKTRSIIGTIHRYVKDHPTHHVTAITFTRKAAEELAIRIGNNNVEVSTIHSWAYRRLQRFAAKYDFKVQLLEDDVIKDILKKLCTKRRQYYLNQWLLYSYVMGNYNVDVDEKIERVFRIIAADYVKFKRQNKLYDFTDLPLYLLDVCQEYDERIEDSDALFVDEFQDIDPVQLAVFEYVDVSKRVYIGDPKQAIYAFRGACSEVFEKFRLPDWTWFTLSINYRSHQNIADYAEAVYDKAQALIKEHDVYSAINFPALVPLCGIECAKGGGGTVVLIMDMNGLALEDGTWADKSVEATEEYITNLVASPNTQILCRSNKQVKKLKTMGIDNVSTVHQAKGLEYDNVVLVDFPQDSEEELNIGYVAATRARNNLAVVNWDLLLYYVAGMSKTEVSKGSNRLF